MSDISIYICLNRFREPLLDLIIKYLNLPAGSKGLDACCGTGYITKLLGESVGPDGHVTGLDISPDFIEYAGVNNKISNIDFAIGDVNMLQFEDCSFDWIISIDGIWPGPKELNCPSEDSSVIINEFYRVLIPAGKLFILYWTSQKLLCGYPLLEARLNTVSSATAPFVEGMKPLYHVLNAKNWLKSAGFKKIYARTFLADIEAPFSDNEKKAINLLIWMLWEKAEAEAGKEDWSMFKRISDPDSDDYVLNNKNYYGFYTYTSFNGTK